MWSFISLESAHVDSSVTGPLSRKQVPRGGPAPMLLKNPFIMEVLC